MSVSVRSLHTTQSGSQNFRCRIRRLAKDKDGGCRGLIDRNQMMSYAQLPGLVIRRTNYNLRCCVVGLHIVRKCSVFQNCSLIQLNIRQLVSLIFPFFYSTYPSSNMYTFSSILKALSLRRGKMNISIQYSRIFFCNNVAFTLT